jgi:hypothetical protein
VFFLLELGLGLKQHLPDQKFTVTELADLSSRFFSISVETGLGIEPSFVAAVFTVCISAELAENHGLFC